LLTARQTAGDDYSLLLNRFALERLLARVSTSPHADRFLLKGALLFALWYDTPHRPTRDADLLGFGPDDEANLIATFRDIAAMDLGDGIVFDPDSVKADAIREDNTYGGTRITLVARIGSARCALQIDVGFGDAVTPGPQTVAYPDPAGRLPSPHAAGLPGLHRDRREVPGHGDAGASEQPHEGLLRPGGDCTAHGTGRRHAGHSHRRHLCPAPDRLPTERPLALTKQFSEDAAKLRQWQAFLNKNRIEAASLGDTVALLDDLLWPPTQVAAADSQATATWRPDALRWV
jgi:hypothetical protein